MNKKIIMSLSVIAAVSAAVIGGTGAFFSDVETSTGNTFTAGAIDLKVDSQQRYNNTVCVNGQWALAPNASLTTPQYPVIGDECGGTWELKDLNPTEDKFFDFDDVKPGDNGSNSVSLHVINNDAWVCAEVSNLANNDNGLTEPEDEVDNTGGVGEGELQQAMLMTIWSDNGQGGGVAGDNIQNGTEPTLYTGAPQAGSWALYDATTGDGPLDPADTAWLGVGWSLPLATGNEVQTDSMTGDISFKVVQSRNNAQFTCGSLNEAPQWVDDGTRTGGDASFVEEEDRGNVLQLTTINDTDSRVRWTNSNLNFDLDTFSGISYDSKQVSAIDAVNGNATMRLSVDLDGNLLTADAEEITYEPYYNIAAHNDLNDASIVPNTWQTWETILAKGKFWGNGGFLGTTPSGGAYGTNVTLAQVLASYPDAKVIGISLGMGTWNVGQVVLVDNLVINGASVSLEN